MAKKRPRVHSHQDASSAVNAAKTEPGYWRQRLFKNSFTYRGKRCEVGHWSVKIQHQGHRKTFSLRDNDPALAARQACDLYQAIVTGGWERFLSTHSLLDQTETGLRRTAAAINGADGRYWSPRLVHRKYTEAFLPRDAEREFSVRIEHAGLSRFFPLGSNNRRIASNRAARIYRSIVKEGWPAAIKLFPRELSLAFRWADSPMAWTYTTVHTQPAVSRSQLLDGAEGRKPTFNVAIVESDNSLRNVLTWCINQEEGCRCVRGFGTSSEALQEIRRQPTHLLLISENLPDQAGTQCLKQLNAVAPKTAGLLYSVYEDAEELFKSSPGGAASYLFRRTPPTRILEAVAEARKHRDSSRDQIAHSVRQYFAATLITLPFGGASSELDSLTRREHEILALLSKGHPDKEIADLLRISTWTVHGHLKKIFEKLKAHNRTDAVVKYLNK